MQNEVSLDQLLKDKTITSKTYDRVKIAKSYIEKKYSLRKIKEEEKKKGNNITRLYLINEKIGI